MNYSMRSNACHARGASQIYSDIAALCARVAQLEHTVDQAYESDDPAAEDLDAKLADARERLLEADADLAHCEDGAESEPLDYHEGLGVEEQLVYAYAHYLLGERSQPFAGSRSNILMHMRSVIENAALRRIQVPDAQILEAARDAYEAECKRRRRRQATWKCNSLQAPSVGEYRRENHE